MSKVRYVYGITAALLIGGSLTNVAVGAQVPLNQPGAINVAPRPGAPMSFADLAERLTPAVVNISTKQSITIPRQRSLPPGFEEFARRFGVPVPGQTPGQGQGQGQVPGQSDDNVTQRGGSLGSGFIISADGYIVTNNHVVAPARSNAVVESVTVTLSDRTEYQAEVVGRDEASDLAVLKITPRSPLPLACPPTTSSSASAKTRKAANAANRPRRVSSSPPAQTLRLPHSGLCTVITTALIAHLSSVSSGSSGSGPAPVRSTDPCLSVRTDNSPRSACRAGLFGVRSRNSVRSNTCLK